MSDTNMHGPLHLPGLTSHRSISGPHGGGTPYDQMPLSQGWQILPTIPGHSQQQNISIPSALAGFLKK